MGKEENGSSGATLLDVLKCARCKVILVVCDKRDDMFADATKMYARNGMSLIDKLQSSRILNGVALLGLTPTLSLHYDNEGDVDALVISVWPFGETKIER